jgi:hypothetical protein
MGGAWTRNVETKMHTKFYFSRQKTVVHSENIDLNIMIILKLNLGNYDTWSVAGVYLTQDNDQWRVFKAM